MKLNLPLWVDCKEFNIEKINVTEGMSIHLLNASNVGDDVMSDIFMQLISLLKPYNYSSIRIHLKPNVSMSRLFNDVMHWVCSNKQETSHRIIFFIDMPGQQTPEGLIAYNQMNEIIDKIASVYWGNPYINFLWWKKV